MKKTISLLPLLLAILLAEVPLTLFAQGISASYTYYSKRNVTDEMYYVTHNMILDWEEDRSVFYSYDSFCRDSLTCIAFDDSGEIKDKDAYAELFDYSPSASKDVTFIDYSKGTFIQAYQNITVFIFGNDTLTMPEWELTGESRTTKRGFNVKKAVAYYLGRKWTAWYCEEIPVPAGPWLLWGAPGLIIQAGDSEMIFQFDLTHLEQFEDNSRYDRIKDYYENFRSARNVHLSYDLKKAEQINTKMKRDIDYNLQVANMPITNITMVNKDGSGTTPVRYFDYIPLIPDSYWQK